MAREAKGIPLVDALRKLRECGFEGVEPSLLTHISEKEVDAWVAASKESGLIIDGTIGGRTENLEPGIDLTKKVGGDSMLVVVRYDTTSPLVPQWNRSRDELKAAAPHAAKQGIKILIENVWATFLISAFDMARFI